MKLSPHMLVTVTVRFELAELQLGLHHFRKSPMSTFANYVIMKMFYKFIVLNVPQLYLCYSKVAPELSTLDGGKGDACGNRKACEDCHEANA